MCQHKPVSTLHLSLLGTPRVVRNGQPMTAFRTSKSQALLYYLAVTASTHHRSTLTALLWPESSETQANASLRTILADLRKLVGDHLTITRHTAAVETQGLWLDVAQFDALLRRTAERAVDVLQMQAAVSLYAGDFLEGFHVPAAPPFDQWLMVERERLRLAMTSTLLALADWHTEQQDYATSLDHVTRLLAIDPVNEAGHRHKMVLLVQMGQRSAALQHYESCRRVLAEELGVEPAPETLALHELILAGVTGATLSPGAAALAPNTARPAVAQVQPAQGPLAPRLHATHFDRRDMPEHTAFYGRQQDLVQLSHWLAREGAGLVAIAGMGGVGKTTLAAELVTRLPAEAYDLVIWRSLVNARPLDAQLDTWLQTMTGHHLDHLPDSLDEKLALLFAELQRQRCLLVLDNLESIMQPATGTGYFRPGYQDYGQLIDRMGRSRHQSCLLLTTRELPKGLRRLEEDYPRVRIMALGGLPLTAGMDLLRQRGIAAPDGLLKSLVERYSGNPLALKLVADTVRDLFGSDVAAFLGNETPVFDDIHTVLDEQFDRLSTLERDVVTWLAIERVPMAATVLWDDLLPTVRRRDFLEAMRFLQRNSLVETVIDDNSSSRLALQNVVMEYVTDRLVQTVCQEIERDQPDWLRRFALVKAHSQEHVQGSQRRLLLQPVVDWLVARWGQAEAAGRLRSLLLRLRQAPGYAAANILHLLVQLPVDVRGLDLSGLAVWQADLRTTSLIDVDLHGADLRGSTFADTFGALQVVRVSPDGRYLATGGSDGTVFVWQMADFQPFLTLPAHTQGISRIAWSPDSARLASCSYDYLVRLWDVQTGQLLDTLRAHTDTVSSVVIGPDGIYLASAGADQTIVVTDTRTGTIDRRLSESAWINHLALSADGQTLASVNAAGEVNLWSWRTGDRRQTLGGHAGKLHAVVFSPQGELLATGGEDGRVYLWHGADLSQMRVLHGHAGWVMSLAFSPDGRRLASASTDRTVRIWDVDTGRIERTLLGHTNWVTSVTYSPDGSTVVSGSYDQSVRLWDAVTGRLVHRLHGHLRWTDAVRFSPDGRLLASSGLDGPIRLWDIHSGRLLHTLRGHHGAVRALAFARTNGLLAAGCDDHHAYVWDVTSGRLKYVLRGHGGLVRSVAFSPGDHLLVTGSYDQTLRVWLVSSGQLLRIVPGTGVISQFSMAFDTEERLLACMVAEHHSDLIHPPSGSVVERFDVAPQQPLVVAHGVREHLLACGTQEGDVWVWEENSMPGSEPARLRFQAQSGDKAIARLQFSPDGHWLAAYTADDQVHLLDTGTGQILYDLSDVPAVSCLAFSRTGKELICGNSLREVVIRNAATGEVQRTLRGHTSDLTAIDASPVEDLVASGSSDGVVRLWDAVSGECRTVLTPEGPYAGMNISGATGISATQRATLVALGAVDDSTSVSLVGSRD